eukprot:4902666-Pleurochrysis_carterae.AAC.1
MESAVMPNSNAIGAGKQAGQRVAAMRCASASQSLGRRPCAADDAAPPLPDRTTFAKERAEGRMVAKRHRQSAGQSWSTQAGHAAT